MRAPAADVEVVTSGRAALELGRQRQPSTGWCSRRRTAGEQWRRQLCIDIGGVGDERKSARVTPRQIALDPARARAACVGDLRDAAAARRLECHLHVLPVALERREVERQSPVEKAVLGADFIIGQLVGVERRSRPGAIDAARPEPARHGCIDQMVGVDLVGDVGPVGETIALGLLRRNRAVGIEHAQIGARRSVDDGNAEPERSGLGPETLANARAEKGGVDPKESDKRIVELVGAQAAGDGQLVGQVEVELAERGIVAVDPVLAREPDLSRSPRHRKSRCEIGRQVIVLAQFGLALVE